MRASDHYDAYVTRHAIDPLLPPGRVKPIVCAQTNVRGPIGNFLQRDSNGLVSVNTRASASRFQVHNPSTLGATDRRFSRGLSIGP